MYGFPKRRNLLFNIQAVSDLLATQSEGGYGKYVAAVCGLLSLVAVNAITKKLANENSSAGGTL